VHEQDDAIGHGRFAQGRAGEHALADVQLCLLARYRRHGRRDRDVVIDRQQPLAVIAAG